MGRISKHSLNEKIQAVHDFQNGTRSKIRIANDLQCDVSTVRQWIRTYETLGVMGLKTKARNRAYTKEKKLLAINDYLDGQGSLFDIAAKHGISTGVILRKWVIKYNDHEDVKDYDPKGEVYMAKSRKTVFEERIQIVKYCLENGKQYKLAAEFFSIPYMSVYLWTKRYVLHGEQALQDRRGHRKPKLVLTETDKLRLELSNEKTKNQRLEMKLELIKKKQEIEVRLASQKLGKKRNI